MTTPFSYTKIAKKRQRKVIFVVIQFRHDFIHKYKFVIGVLI